MYILIKDNVEKNTNSELVKNELVKMGYSLVNPEIEPKMEVIDLESLSIEELLTYAAKNSIDVGKSTSTEGIIKKIKEAQDGGDADGKS